MERAAEEREELGGDKQPRGTCVAMRMILPADANSHGTVFGGAVISEYDLAGATAARKFLGLSRLTTRHLSIDFTRSLYPGDVFTIYAELERIGGSSVTIHLEGWRMSPEGFEERFSSVQVVFVYLSEDGRPRQIPEEKRARAAQIAPWRSIS